MPTIFSLLILAIHITALIVLLLISVRLVRNLSFLRRAQQPDNIEHSYPRVSVLVPARNEEATIADCLKSLVHQDYPEFEILVLDDQSTDNTLAEIQQLAAQHAVIRVLHGDSAPPSGWNGKSYACHRLAEQACGDWLLFTDADTCHTPQSIAQGIEQALRFEVDLLSAMPRQITRSWSEHLMVPLIMDFLPLLGVDLQSMWHGRSPHAIANGQYMLIRKTAYQAAGGHAAIRNALVDDFALVDHFMQNNLRLALVDGTEMVACQMYHNAGEVWHGFSKNIVLSLQTARGWPFWSIVLFAWGYISLFVLPSLLLILHPHKLLPLIEVIWLILLRSAVAVATRRPLIAVMFTPLSAIGVMALGLNALLLKWTRKRIAWKERLYSVNQ